MPYTTQWSLLAKIDLGALRSNPPAQGAPYHAGQGAFLESDFAGVTIEAQEHWPPIFLNAAGAPGFDAVRAVFELSYPELSYQHRNGPIDFWGGSGLYHDFAAETTGAVWPSPLTGLVGEVIELECYLSRPGRPGMARLRRPRLGDDFWEESVTWSHDEWFAEVPFGLEMPLNVVHFGGIASLYINAAPAGAQNFWTDFRHSVEVV